MTSRLTLSALVFSILSTLVLVGTAAGNDTGSTVAATRVVQFDPVTITAKRLPAEA